MQDGAEWSQAEWKRLERETSSRCSASVSDEECLRLLGKQARRVIRSFSTSFFIVTRFLPPAKRLQVELIYAAVRYPDEVVDTFPVSASEKLALLDRWQDCYETALTLPSLRSTLAAGLPTFVAGFAEVVRANDIPHEHYRSFLDAMRADVVPAPFASLEDLIDDYVYGSAVVVGYFLTYVYGASTPSRLDRALSAARELGIALQLTNFLRDVSEDAHRGRLYLPLDRLRAAGIETFDPADPEQHEALCSVIRSLADVAETGYARAESDLDAFAADSRPAIQACIGVYRQLNDRVGRSKRSVVERQSVPMRAKFGALPTSKYWRVPLAYLGL